MDPFFRDTKGILLLDSLEKGQTINREYYANLLDQLNVKTREKRSGLAKKKIFDQDNVRPHICVVSVAKIAELKYDLLHRPPYSPDLAPSDFHLFLSLIHI